MGLFISGSSLLIAQAVTIGLIFFALLAPVYHRENMHLPGGYSMLMELSLFRAKTSANCFLVAPPSIYTVGVFSPTLCQQLVNHFNGMSLGDLSRSVCG